MPVITTLNFAGRTEEALSFYTQALNAETVFLLRFRDCPDPRCRQVGQEDLIFHATFRIAGTQFMASDVGAAYAETATAPVSFAGFALALQLDSIQRARPIFAALSEGGLIVIPLAESAFTGWYGLVVDRFGVSWKLNVAPAAAAAGA